MKVSGSGPVRRPASSASIASISRGRQLEVEDVEVLLDALRRDRLGDHDVAELQMPADHDLAARAPVRLGIGEDRRILEHETLRERAPSLGDDPELLVLAAQTLLLEVGMQLDLVDRRRLTGLRDQALEVRGLEVRHADRADQAPRRAAR